MTRLRSLGLRARLAIALVSIALLTVGLATILSHQGVHPRLEEAAQARQLRAATQVAAEAADLYAQGDGWSDEELHGLEHSALLNQLQLRILHPDGTPLNLSEAEQPAPGSEGAATPIVSRLVYDDGAPTATILLAPLDANPLTPEETQFERSLNELHVIAGAIAIAAALVLAFILAQTLARPLRRIRDGAHRIADGDLATRVDPQGGPELADVAHALNQLADTLVREEELRRDNIASVAHEFRTPVSGLLSRIEAAQDGVLQDQEANLAAMHAETLRLTRLLDDLSQLAEAQQPNLTLRRRPTDLSRLAHLSADRLRNDFDQKHVELVLSTNPAPLRADPERLSQIIDNLLSNALRYTPDGGRVTVRTESLPGRALLEIEDNGIGISEDDQARVFDRFWRAEQSRSRASGGAGIGLAIARELVLAHAGTITVDSEPGRGSRFTVLLPSRLHPVTDLRPSGDSRSTTDQPQPTSGRQGDPSPRPKQR